MMSNERIDRLNKLLHIVRYDYNNKKVVMVVKTSKHFKYRLYKKNNELVHESTSSSGTITSGANHVQCYNRQAIIENDGTTFDAGLSVPLSDIIAYGTCDELLDNHPEFFI